MDSIIVTTSAKIDEEAARTAASLPVSVHCHRRSQAGGVSDKIEKESLSPWRN
jgi:hypothetical protein